MGRNNSAVIVGGRKVDRGRGGDGGMNGDRKKIKKRLKGIWGL